MEHPRDVNNRYMKLLAQLNFEEIPPLEDMPKQGILQFFIAAEDDVHGINFDNMTNQQNFKILFHNYVEKDESLLVSDFSYMNDLDTTYFPIQSELALTFNIDYEPISICDYKNSELLDNIVDLWVQVSDGESKKELWEVYNDAFISGGHKVGGYPFFTQTDPREDEKSYRGNDILLLQVDSDFDDIMWGDSGVANFFICKEDLLNLDFSNVIYNWDCY